MSTTNEQGAEAPEATPAPKPKKARWVPPELTQEIIDDLEAKHEDIMIMRGDPDVSPWVLVLRRPTRPETLIYKTASRRTEGNQGVIANEQLIRATTVWPEHHHVDVMFKKWGMLADGIASSERYKAFLGVQADADLKG